MSVRIAREDPELRATVIARRPLHYDAGPDASLDRPGHVRAGSGLGWIRGPSGPRLVVAQDDTSFLAVLDPSSGSVESITLDHVDRGMRQFDAGRGNKKRKLDLEACCVVRRGGRETLLALGSGSLPIRERIVVWESAVGESVGSAPRIVDASALYAQLRARVDFAGSELNIEGAAVVGDRLRLFQRGNGAPLRGLLPIDATCDLELAGVLAWIDGESTSLPPITNVVQWELGRVGGVRLTFTDACARGDGVTYLAAAEASPDAIEDGDVAGVAIGWIDAAGEGRWGAIREPDGALFLGKCEGLAWAERGERGSVTRALVVVDRDDPDLPSELCEIDIEGLPTGP